MKFFFLSLRLALVWAFLIAGVFSGAGCSVQAKADRHIKRADAYFAKGQLESARIEYLNAFRLNQNNPHVAARLGEAFLEIGDVQRGFQLLSHARELQPTNNAVRVKIASLLLMSGDAKRARAEAQEILKSNPLDGDALVLLANSAASTNEVAESKRLFESMLASAPQNPSLHLALGVLAQRTGDLAAAQTQFGEAVRLDPKSSKSHFALANICFALGDTNKAEVHFKAAKDSAALKSVERLGYSEFLFKTGRAAEAKSLLEETTKQSPDFLGAWTMLTQIALSQRDTNSAAQYVAKALERDPNNRDALLNRSRLKIAAREYAAASADLQTLAEKFPRDAQVLHQLALAQLGADDAVKALSTLDRAVTLSTNSFDSVLLRAQIQINRGQVNDAIPELVRLTRSAPRVPQPQYLLAGAYLQQRSFAQAVAVYSNLAVRFPTDPQPYQMIGGIHRQQTNFPAARQSYEAALKINPDFLPAIDDLIELDILAQRPKDALARVQGYIEKYPDKPMPRLLQAKILFAENKNTEAEAAVQKAIELDPEFYSAHRALADFYVRTKQLDPAIQKLESMVAKNAKDVASLLQVGMLYESKTNFAKARGAYENLLKVNPSSIPALNNLAYILSERVGDLDAAYQTARKARDLDPYSPFVADTFGWILFKRGEYQPALAALQQAADRLQNQPEIAYHVGMTHYMLGAVEPATAALTSAVNATEEYLGKDSARNALAVLRLDPAKASPDSLGLLAKTVQSNPKDAFAWTRLAQVHESQKNWDKARESYEKALQVNPRSPLILSRLAALYSGPLNNSAKGMEFAKQAWSAAQTPDIAGVLGPIGYRAGDLRWAYGVLLEAQRSQNPSAEAAYYLGLASYALGRLPQSLESFQNATRFAGLPAALSGLAKAGAALVGHQSGEVAAPQAQTAIAAATAADPAFPPALISAGLLAEQKRDFPAARAKYEEVIRANPAFLIAQRQLALLLADKLGDDAKAAEIAATLRTDFANDPALSAMLGKIAFRRGDYTEAARILRTATLQPGASPELLHYLGMAQFHLKDNGAQATLTRAVAEAPEAKLVADAKKALAELQKK